VPATIRDVARAAGVSPSTVSRALTNPHLVSASTRERVRAVADRLGYVVSRSVGGPGRTGSIGFVVPDLTNPLFAGVVKGAQARARESGYTLVVADSDEEASAEAGAVRSLTNRVDGIVVSSPRSSITDLTAIVGNLPLVLHHKRNDAVPCVTVDNLGGMAQAVAHLAALGHRRIGYVGGPSTSEANAERVEGFRAAGRAHGLEIVEIGSFPSRYEGGVAAADLVAASGVTGVIAFNDVVALGLMARVRARGISVPDDLSVVGFDDVPVSRMISPPLTSVVVPQERAGRACVEMLLGHLGAGPIAGLPQLELVSALVVRATTAEPRS